MIGQLSDRLSYKAWMPFKCTEGNVHLFLFSQVMWSFSVVNVFIGTMYYIKLNSCVCISPLILRYNKNSCRSERVMRESKKSLPQRCPRHDFVCQYAIILFRFLKYVWIFRMMLGEGGGVCPPDFLVCSCTCKVVKETWLMRGHKERSESAHPTEKFKFIYLHSNFTEIMRLNPPPPKLKFNQSL